MVVKVNGTTVQLPPKVQVLVQAESLFNAATSLVLFKVAIGIAVAAGPVNAGAGAGQFGGSPDGYGLQDPGGIRRAIEGK